MTSPTRPLAGVRADSGADVGRALELVRERAGARQNTSAMLHPVSTGAAAEDR
ncbi:hypothetical protein [Catellatospora vulcania]|uniref:hypothetical protein n=1 Tax=Catellatospora vulcania TaxID=1460450 RepID=UPI0012D4AD4D|nr:hypothetical protein [Catellatospora vulcania]